jgi:DNA-binding transcriptional regulator YdaS (Cro superfamily)
MDTNLSALARAIEIAGGQTALARAIECKQAHVWNWLNRDKCVPAEKCRAIEAATNGQVTRYELRPDVFGEAPSQEAAA